MNNKKIIFLGIFLISALLAISPANAIETEFQGIKLIDHISCQNKLVGFTYFGKLVESDTGKGVPYQDIMTFNTAMDKWIGTETNKYGEFVLSVHDNYYYLDYDFKMGDSYKMYYMYEGGIVEDVHYEPCNKTIKTQTF